MVRICRDWTRGTMPCLLEQTVTPMWGAQGSYRCKPVLSFEVPSTVFEADIYRWEKKLLDNNLKVYLVVKHFISFLFSLFFWRFWPLGLRKLRVWDMLPNPLSTGWMRCVYILHVLLMLKTDQQKAWHQLCFQNIHGINAWGLHHFN